MRLGLVAAGALVVLAGCAHAGMNHADMARHCQMMQQHQGEDHDPAEHGGMSHEEMMRHCQMMREHHPAAPDSTPQPQN